MDHNRILGFLEPIDPDITITEDLPLAAQRKSGSIPIKKNRLVKFGRNDKECDVLLTHPSVSSIHCMFWAIRFDEESVPMCYLKDCSLNGTILNGKSLTRGQTCLLDHGDIITIPNEDREYKFNVTTLLQSVDFMDQLGFKSQVNDWRITPRVIGSGTFGHVMVSYKEKEKHGSLKLCCPFNYAVKIIRMKPSKVDKEASILLKLNHPNIIKVHQTYCDPRGNLYIFQDLISGGDLFSYLAKTDCLSPITETESLIIVYQILQALKYLHKQGIVHRDLKLDNILLSSPEPCTRIVLADFGIATDLSSTRTRMHTVVGTPEYCAPEVGFKANRTVYKNFSRAATLEQQKTGYDAKCDLWSLGVITHIMLTGISPFYGDGSESSIIKNAKLGKLSFDAKQWSVVSDNAKGFVRSLLEINVNKRMDSGSSLNHLWIAKHRGQLEKIYRKKILGETEALFEWVDKPEIVDQWKRKLPKSVVLTPTGSRKKKGNKISDEI